MPRFRPADRLVTATTWSMSKQPLKVVSGLLPAGFLAFIPAKLLGIFIVFGLALGLCFQARAAVIINELYASPSDQQLTWSSNGVPRLGSGIAWLEPDFPEHAWSSGNLPAGYG